MPEVEELSSGKPITIASEFPNGAGEVLSAEATLACGRERAFHGGVILFKLKSLDTKLQTSSSITCTVQHRTETGMLRTNKQEVVIDMAEPFCTDAALRKVIALQHFVKIHNAYVASSKATPTRLQELLLFEPWFRDELAACGDHSLDSNNQAFAQTLRQMTELEQSDLQDQGIKVHLPPASTKQKLSPIKEEDGQKPMDVTPKHSKPKKSPRKRSSKTATPPTRTSKRLRMSPQRLSPQKL